MRRRRQRGAWALLLACALATTACGGDDSTGSTGGGGGRATTGGGGGASSGGGGSTSTGGGGAAGGGGMLTDGGAGGGGGIAADGGVMCTPQAQDCSSVDCCDDSICITGGAVGSAIVCAAKCTDHFECLSGCCANLTNSTETVCQPSSVCTPAEPCSVVLLADDGTYLGEATGDTFETDGVCNPFSDYGSEFSSTSIFNPFSDYGSEFSVLSAYNDFTTTPPVVFDECSSEIVAVVTTNEFLFATAPLVHPDNLCTWLDLAGL